eukprot:Anaeramoba_ignava/a609762_14.p3 GENE.a609762_14~~a609762_14.p3  ORF type:complete len:105 (-),score=9.71 a609762_14:983-1297(-)
MENLLKIKTLLQFALKAGRLSIGITAVIKSVLYKKARLIIIASDCGTNIEKKINAVLKDDKVYVYRSDSDKNSLGEILNYNKVSIASVNDENFAKGILKKIKNE